MEVEGRPKGEEVELKEATNAKGTDGTTSSQSLESERKIERRSSAGSNCDTSDAERASVDRIQPTAAMETRNEPATTVDDDGRDRVGVGKGSVRSGVCPLSDSISSITPAPTTTTASDGTFTRECLSLPSSANTRPLSCDTTATTKTPKAPPIDGLLTIATPKLLKYGPSGKDARKEEEGDNGVNEEPSMRLFVERRDAEDCHSPRRQLATGATEATYLGDATATSFRTASPATSSTPFLRQRQSVGVFGKSTPRSFSPPVLRSATSSTLSPLSLPRTLADTSTASATTLNAAITTCSPCKIAPSTSPFPTSPSHITPSSLSPFAQQMASSSSSSRPQQQQQRQQPSSSLHAKAMPRRDLRLDFLSGPVSLKRCNSAPAIDLKLVTNVNHGGPYFGATTTTTTTPTTPTTSESTAPAAAAAAIQSDTPPVVTSPSINAASSSTILSHNSTCPSPILPSPTRRASAATTLFRPIPAMSPSAGGEGNDAVGRRSRRFSSNSVGGGCGGGARSTSPYPLPRTPSRLEQILNDEFCNPLAREEADEREMNEVASISSSCDKLDLLGIEKFESSSSAFGSSNLSLLSNNLSLLSNNNNNSDDGGVPTSGFQSGRGLGAAFGIDFSSVATTCSTSSTTVAFPTTTRQSPLFPNHRSRTNSDPMAGSSPSLPPSGGILGLPAAPSLHLSINLNPTGGSGASQASPSTMPTCSPSPTGSGGGNGGGGGGGGGLSNVKQRFSPRRQVSYHHPPSPINSSRRSLSPLASAGHNGIKRKIHSSESGWGSGPECEPFPKFPRTSVSRGSTPERGFPTPSVSPGLSPKGASSSSASTQQSSIAGSVVASVAASSSTSSTIGSLPSSPSTPQPPSPSTLSGNPFSRSGSPTPPAITGGGVVGKCPPLPFQDASSRGRQLSVSSSSAESSFSSLDESGNSAGLHFAGFTAAPRTSSSSSSFNNFCMTPPSHGSPAPPPQLQLQQQLPRDADTIDDTFRKFSWPSGAGGGCDKDDDDSINEKEKRDDSEGVGKRGGINMGQTPDAETMETDAN